MSIVGGLDIHRKQITFDYLDTGTGQVRRGQVNEQITDNEMSAPTDSSMSRTACSLTSAGAETAVHRH